MTWMGGARMLVCLAVAGCLVLNARTPRGIPGPALKSSSALVVDQHTGQALLEKRAGAAMPIASLSKLMTAMVLLDARLDPHETLSITEDDKDRLRHSKSHLPVGTSLTREEALILTLAASENRASHALGRTYPGGLTALVGAMNAKAKALGLAGTRFVDPSGLSSDNVATARDLARLLESAFAYPEIRDFSTRPGISIQAGKRILEFPNTNPLVRNPRWTIGISKTGFIQEAGRCLAMQTMVANRPVFIILLDSWGKYTRLGDANRIRQWMESRLTQQG